jgi:cyclopropane fatty-acyl-phospholipid synthase-like methyltransferase
MNENKKYQEIKLHYEECLERFGDTPLGVDWPKLEDVEKRYQVMIEIIKYSPFHTKDKISLLDFGCGASHLYEYLLKNKTYTIEYSGLDISQKFIALSKNKFPDTHYYWIDILDDNVEIPNFDYIILNGVFTEKIGLSFEEMYSYFKKVIIKIYTKADQGIAFNVMSKHVDWERDDLFHVPFDLLADFLIKKLSRNFVFRNDYGLYEYTTYVYK